MNLKTPVKICLVFIGTLVGLYMVIVIYSCIRNPNLETMGKKYSEQEWVAASKCEYEVCFLSTSTYKTLEDFWDAVGDAVIYLNKNGYKVLDVVPKYGRDMTQKEVLKFVHIKYIKEVKNE